MYNLFISSQAGKWENSADLLDRGRFLEHTEDTLCKKYRALGPAAVAELLTFPALFAYEKGVKCDAKLGRVMRIQPRENSIRIEYEITPKVPSIPPEQFTRLGPELDVNASAMTRTHWSVKDVDLLKLLVKANVLKAADVRRISSGTGIATGHQKTKRAPSMVIHPSVFRVPTGSIETDLFSVMMPFSPSFDAVYESLKDACDESGLRPQRVDNMWEESEVIQDVFSLIYRSCIVICDFSGKNPNVFYEAGIAHTLGRPVIPILQNEADAPFDLQHHRYIKYLDNAEGRHELSRAVKQRLQTLKKK